VAFHELLSALQFFTPQIAMLAGSTTFREVSRGALRKFKIPVPPLSEQRRIVEILDQADELRRKSAEADTKAKPILSALFYKLFGAPANWLFGETVPLRDIVHMVSGATPSRDNREYWHGSVPWVSPKDVKRERIGDSQEHISDSAAASARLRLLAPGAILIVVRGMILARTVPISLVQNGVTINQDLKALLVRDDRFNPEYLWAALRMMEPNLLGLVSTAAHGTRKLDTDVLLNSRVLIPSASKATRFHRATDITLSLLDKQRDSSCLIEGLFSCVMQRAFSGALTAKWREGHLKELLSEMAEQARALDQGWEETKEPASP